MPCAGPGKVVLSRCSAPTLGSRYAADEPAQTCRSVPMCEFVLLALVSPLSF